MTKPKKLLDTPRLIPVNRDAFSNEMDWNEATFWKIVGRYHQSLYRYYAVHTNGDLNRALDMTLETFSIMRHKYPSLQRHSFANWLFGIAWDVLNAYFDPKEASKRRSKNRAGTTLKVQKFGSDHAEIRHMLKVLRTMTFYPRETLYLRFLAELNIKDIGVLMDKSENAVKVLVLQGLAEFISQMDGISSIAHAKEQQLALAQVYHLYLNDALSGITPRQNVSVEFARATSYLKTLHDAVTMQPDAHHYLISQLEHLFHSGDSSTTSL